MVDLMISDQTIHLLEKSLDVSARRHRVLANNIANQDTMGFQPKDLDFKETLKRELEDPPEPLERTHAGHLKHRYNAYTSGMIRPRSGGAVGDEPVNIDTEMTNLMENNIKYKTSVELLLRKMRMFKTAIVEGGR